MKPDSRRPTTASRQPDPQRRQATTRKTTRRERALVLGPFLSCVVICVIYGVFFRIPAPGLAGAALAAMALAASVLWIVAAGLALALDRAIRHPNRSYFMRQDQAPEDEAGKDWDTRTGSFAWMEDWEDFQFDDDHYH